MLGCCVDSGVCLGGIVTCVVGVIVNILLLTIICVFGDDGLIGSEGNTFDWTLCNVDGACKSIGSHPGKKCSRRCVYILGDLVTMVIWTLNIIVNEHHSCRTFTIYANS